MQASQFLECLDDCPIIASVKDGEGLAKALESKCRVVFILYGDLLSIKEIVGSVKAAGKAAFVHVDLIEGLASKDISVDYIRANTRADGILSTKVNLVKRASALGLLAIQRYFVLDSLAFQNIHRQFARDFACAIEVLPGVMPKVIAKLSETSNMPIITGGMIFDKEDVMGVLKAGARAVSATSPEIWFL